MSNLRTVTVFGTRGKKVKVNTDVTTWGELRPLLENEGVSLNNMKATESIGRTTLEHKDALLPDKDFTLFTRAVKTKSGADVEGLSYKEMKAKVAEFGDDCKEFLNSCVDGKTNWTRLSTAELRAGLTAFSPVVAEEEEVEEVEETEEKAVEETQETEEAGAVEEVAEEIEAVLTPLDKVNQVITLLTEICDEVESEDVCDRIADLKDDCQGLTSDLEEIYSPEAAAKREEEALAEQAAREADEAETKALEAEQKEINDGFIN